MKKIWKNKKIISFLAMVIAPTIATAVLTTQYLNNVSNKTEIKQTYKDSFVASRSISENKNLSETIWNEDWYDSDFIEYANIPDENIFDFKIDSNETVKQNIKDPNSFLGLSSADFYLPLSFSTKYKFKKTILGNGAGSFFKIINQKEPDFISINDDKFSFITSVEYNYHLNYRSAKPGSSGSGSNGRPTSGSPEVKYQKLKDIYFIDFKENYFVSNVSSGTSSNKYKRKATISLSNQNIDASYLNYNSSTEFNINKILMVDDDYTFRGFDTNNFAFKVNDEYLKTLIVLSCGVAKANELLKNATEEQKQDNKFLAIVDALANGHIVDTTNPIIQKLGITHNDVGGIENTLSNYLMKYLNGIDFIDELNNQTTKYAQLAYMNDLNVTDPYLAYKMKNLFFNEVGSSGDYFAGLEFDVQYTTTNGHLEGTKTIQVKWNDLAKKFDIYTKNPDGKVIKGFIISDKEHHSQKNSILITNVSLKQTSDAGSFSSIEELNNVGFYDLNNNIITPNNTENNRVTYTSKPEYDVTKLIKIKTNYTANELSKLAERNLTSKELNEPSTLLNDKVFLTNLLTFSQKQKVNNEELSIEIIDPTLKEYVINSGDNLMENQKLKQLFESFNVEAFDSVNGIELVINFKDIDRDGKTLLSDESKISSNKFQTSFTLGKDINNEILNNKISNFNYDESLSLDENIKNELITYKNEKTSNDLINTDLYKSDWNDNSYINLIPNEENKSYAKGKLIYTDSANAYNWLNNIKSENINKQTQNAKVLNFEIDKVNNTIKTYSANSTNTIMWVGIGIGIAILIIASGLTYYFIKKKNNNIIDDEEDED